MKCPRCEALIPYIHCSKCGDPIPEKSNFCCWCGSQVLPKEEQSDLSTRVLCPDGTCIGVINASGVCNICGKPLAG